MGLHHAQTAFIDAFGNTDVETGKEGVSTHYILAAVIVAQPEVQRVRAEIEKVRVRHFQTGEMKSSSIAANDDRRLRVLRDLVAIAEWHVFVSSIDKRELSGGLMYKKPFLKALHGDLFRKLYEAYPVLGIVCDEVGTADFMRSFESYIQRRHLPLFSTGKVEFMSSKNEVLIQLADVVARLRGPRNR